MSRSRTEFSQNASDLKVANPDSAARLEAASIDLSEIPISHHSLPEDPFLIHTSQRSFVTFLLTVTTATRVEDEGGRSRFSLFTGHPLVLQPILPQEQSVPLELLMTFQL